MVAAVVGESTMEEYTNERRAKTQVARMEMAPG